MFFKRKGQGLKLKEERELALYERVTTLQKQHVKQQHLKNVASAESEAGTYYRLRISAKYNYLYKIARKLYALNKNS